MIIKPFFSYQMEPMSGLNQDLGNVELGKAEGDTVEVEGLNKTIDDILQKVTQVTLFDGIKTISNLHFCKR